MKVNVKCDNCNKIIKLNALNIKEAKKIKSICKKCGYICGECLGFQILKLRKDYIATESDED